MKKPYILAVDDEALNLIILEELLSEKYELSCVGDGASCLESVAKRLPDLILMDINMPIMNGLEACLKLKQKASTRSIPIIMLSALASKTEIQQGLDAGADAYLSKPFQEGELLDAIKSTLLNRQTRHKTKS